VTAITFAHRGARIDAPENTLEAFRVALAAGATGLESDAWVAADGEVVLVHDDTLRRGLRRVRVREATARELAAFAVPRLADLYAELGTGYELSIDAKHPEVVTPMLDVAAAAGAVDRLWVCAPDLELLRAHRDATAAKLVHSTRKDRVPAPLERHAAELAAAGVDAVNFHHQAWTAGLVALYHRFGVRAFAWDAQEVRHIRALLRMGIDGVYCDRPDRLVATVAEWATEGRSG
jgi:glycerophosphoryl diester phosphodiesterase